MSREAVWKLLRKVWIIIAKSVEFGGKAKIWEQAEMPTMFAMLKLTHNKITNS